MKLEVLPVNHRTDKNFAPWTLKQLAWYTFYDLIVWLQYQRAAQDSEGHICRPLELHLCWDVYSSYYRRLGAVRVMSSALYRTGAFHWQNKKQHERCDPFAFQISIRSRCMPGIFSRLHVLWGRSCWDTSVLCSDGAIVLPRKLWYFYSGDRKSNFRCSLHLSTFAWRTRQYFLRL